MATQLTDTTFNELVMNNKKPVMIDFWATWCGPCRAISPIIDELAGEYEGKVDIFKCNVDENSEVVAKYGIRNIPTLLFIKDGELKNKIVGASTKKAISEKIEELL